MRRLTCWYLMLALPVLCRSGRIRADDEPVLPPPSAAALPSPFEGAAELSVDAYTQQVLERNPSLLQMQAAYQAASARFPQVTSLDDPMIGGTLAPGSYHALSSTDLGWRVDVSQKFPYFGKRELRGQSALAEAGAASADVDDMRLQLTESASQAFADYFLAARALEVNADAVRLLTEFRANAESRYKTGLVPQQDILQAEVEIGRQQERQITLERIRAVALARMNTLMHQGPACLLPPPPQKLDAAAGLVEADVLRATAVARRPDLHALWSRLKGDEIALALAHKEYCPDFEVMAAYDNFWDQPLRAQVAVRLNLPVRYARRAGAVAEAHAKIMQRQAELARQIDQVNFQVQDAYEQVRESERVVKLYRDTILPAAQANIQAAQSAYVTGKTPFVSLIEVERNLIMLRDRLYEATADVLRRRATLDRVIGGPLLEIPKK